MKEDRQDLTTGSIWGKMLFFSIPLVLTNFLQVLFNMADIAVIGQFAGSLSLGAVGEDNLFLLVARVVHGHGLFDLSLLFGRGIGGQGRDAEASDGQRTENESFHGILQ